MYASARFKQPSGESSRSGRHVVCNAVQLVPINFRRMGHGRMVSTLPTAVGGDRGHGFETKLQVTKQFAHKWFYPVHKDMYSCLLHAK